MKCSMYYLLMTWSKVSREVMLKRKNPTKLVAIKTFLFYLFQMTVVLIDHNLFLQLFYATHQGFPISEWTHPIILIGIKLFQLFIYLLSDAKPL